MSDEPIDLEKRRREKQAEWVPNYFVCGECDGEDWTLWIDGPAQCASCGCVAPNIDVKEAG